MLASKDGISVTKTGAKYCITLESLEDSMALHHFRLSTHDGPPIVINTDHIVYAVPKPNNTVEIHIAESALTPGTGTGPAATTKNQFIIYSSWDGFLAALDVESDF
jgi:hypothetical protein